MLLLFFCGVVHADAAAVLRRIDYKLMRLYAKEEVDAEAVAQKVLDALEALYCEQRGGVLERCRTVLLIDEISKADWIGQTPHASEKHVYGAVVRWLNGGVVAGSQQGRRGAVFTGLSAVAPWSKRAPESGRQILWLPLGLFDVFDQQARRSIAICHSSTCRSWRGGTVRGRRPLSRATCWRDRRAGQSLPR